MKVANAVRYASAVAAVTGLTVAGLVAMGQVQAQQPPLKIGVMDGFSGVYGDLTAGEVEAIEAEAAQDSEEPTAESSDQAEEAAGEEETPEA